MSRAMELPAGLEDLNQETSLCENCTDNCMFCPLTAENDELTMEDYYL